MQCRAYKPNLPAFRVLATSAVLALVLQLGPTQAADEPHSAPPATIAASSAASTSAPTSNEPATIVDPQAAPIVTSSIPVRTRFLPLGVGKSVVIDLPRNAKDVLIGDPKIANAVIHSSQRAYIIGMAVGQTNIVFFDADGGQIASYDIAIKRDLNGVRAALKDRKSVV